MFKQSPEYRWYNAYQAYRRAQNPAFKEFWHDIADKLEAKYCVGQPWLRTYDGRVK